MANGKRASMREGPLAALFRKTEEATSAEQAERAAEQARRAGAASRAASAPPTPAAAHPRESGLPHPALGAAAAGARRAEPRVPTPAGAPAPRLLLGDPREHDGAPPPSAPRPRRDAVRARRTPEPRRPAARRRSRVIRVVGVGGAGVNAVNRMVEAEVEGVEFLAVNTDLQSLQQSTRRHHAAHRRRAHARARLRLGPERRPRRPRWRTTTASRRC